MRSPIPFLIRAGAIFAVLLVSACSCGGADPGGAGTGAGGTGVVSCVVGVDPGCGDPCTVDAGCAAELHCGASGTCTSVCTSAGAGCSSGTCVRGRCEGGGTGGGDGAGGDDGGGGGDDGCPSVTVRGEADIPTVILLIDQSGSMTERFGGTTRWKAMESALVDRDKGLIPKLENQVRFGAALYTSKNGSAGGQCPLLKEIEPAIANGAQIAQLLAANKPDGDTPTGESITAIAQQLAGGSIEGGGGRVILLVTDGEPDTCAVPNPQTGQKESVQAAKDASDDGVRTIVLSVGRDVSEPHLQDMANAGAGLPSNPQTPAPFYVADNPDELVRSLEGIVRGVRDCTFQLDAKVDPAQANAGEVTLNGEKLRHGDDWTLKDDDTLELIGQACTDFRSAASVSLSARFPCGVVFY